MLEIPKLKIRIKDFRAIKSADIVLDGITVVAGINGCGKSTISKLLYSTIKTTVEFDKIVIDNLIAQLRDIRYFLDELSREVEFFSKENPENSLKQEKEIPDVRYRFHRLFLLNRNTELREQEIKILTAIDYFIASFENLSESFKQGKRYKTRLYRLERFLKGEFFGKDKELENIELPELLNRLKENVKSKFSKAYLDIENRPLNVLDRIVLDYFSDEVKVNNFNIEELGALITKRSEKKLSNFLTINKVAYIDTPMTIGIENIEMTNVKHWSDLDSLLKNKDENPKKIESISKMLKDEIIQGESKYDSKTETFVYDRNDGFSNDLFSCATGLKSFSILQILYNNGFLDNKTLLIIDEPETHLHPDWIVQYARLIVLLHKELNVNFFIASHNPDMVMALKYISKKELRETDSVNFYLAEENDKFLFDYKHVETDIESIFKSFNSAIDRINLLGATD
jgi:predicted ATP-dependent endonuclease of OLD family